MPSARRGWRRGPLPARSIRRLGARGLAARWGSRRRLGVGPQMRALGAGPGDRTRAATAASGIDRAGGARFSSRRPAAGLAAGGGALPPPLPRAPDDRNELSDEVSLG